MQLIGERRAPEDERARQRVWFAHVIRGPACLLVVLTHLGEQFPMAQSAVAPIGHFQPLGGLPTVPWVTAMRAIGLRHHEPGVLAVLLLFLVSGFAVPYALERGNLKSFFVRRFFRLYPTLWICLLVTGLVLAFQGHVLGYPFPYGRRVIASNALLISPYARLPWIEPIVWTLAIEEMFYGIGALLSWRQLLGNRSAILVVVAGLTVISLATRHAPVGLAFWVGFNATLVIFIFIGVVVHQLYRRRWGMGEGAAMIGVIYAAYLVSVQNGPMAPQAGYVWSSVAALVVFGGLFLARDHLPYSKLLDHLSNISYPLYLLHMVNGYVMMRAIYLLTGSYYLALAAAVAATIGLATVVHLFVETPTNEYGRRLGRRIHGRSSATSPVTVTATATVSTSTVTSTPEPTVSGPPDPAPTSGSSFR